MREILRSVLPLFDMSLEKITFCMQISELEIFKSKIIFDAESLPVEMMEEGLETDTAGDGEEIRKNLQEFFSDVSILKEVHKVPFE